MDLGFLRSLYENPDSQAGAGYVSVYLETSPAIEHAPRKVSLRWRSAKEQLAADGADTPTLAAVQDHLTGRTHAAPGMAVFGCGGAVRLSSTLTVPPPLEISRYARLPHVMPLLAQSPRHVAHVRVEANREGGQVLAFSAAGTSEHATVHGESWPVNKVSVGAWSQLRLERSTEDAWGDNAKRLADTAVVAAERVQAEFVVVGGDVRARTIVLDLLPPQVRESTVIVDREAAPDAPAFAAAAQAEAARRGASESRAKLDDFRARITGG
ncbi:MAG TPA: Vms1/Ankzf1 family peptidyl-tRNA hydrolase, partial [Trebonia sp.]